jgi:transposase
MLSLNGTTRVFLKTGATDGRLGMDGLFAKVKDEMAQNPTCGFYFGFCNRAKNRLRVLSFDGSGLTLFIKRLERSTFRWPKDGNSEIDPMAFQALLCGLEVQERRGWYRHPRPGSTPAPQATTQPSGSPLSAAALSSAA